MKAKVRKRAQQLLRDAPKSADAAQLKEQLEKKGFLSKRELKVLERLVSDMKVA